MITRCIAATTHDKMIVMAAYARGVECQWRPRFNDGGVGTWQELSAGNTEPSWDWGNSDYRVKPAPRIGFICRERGVRMYSSAEQAQAYIDSSKRGERDRWEVVQVQEIL